MDFETYETFLENLSSVMRGIDCLIKIAEGKSGKRFVWSPVAPDIVKEGVLTHVEWGFVYTDIKDIPQAILQHINEDNYVVELACSVDEDDKKPSFSLFVGY